MRRENVRCPVCGTMNRSLDLHETDGYMECIECGNVLQLVRYEGLWHIPKGAKESTLTLVPVLSQ